MTFKDARSVIDTIQAGDEVELVRSRNRTVVSNLGNGKKPMSDEQAKQLNLLVNVDWGEGPSLFAQALRQFTNAFQRTPRYFRVSLPDAPPEKQQEWGMAIGGFINRVMKKSLEYFYVIQQQNASIIAHGVGPEMWEHNERWLSRFVPMRDLRVPTNTEVSFRNLEWFSVRYQYTEGELAQKVWSDDSPEGWNKEAIAQILESYHDTKYDQGTTWINDPEKMAQLIKQNGGLYQSDAVPTIPLWHFYFKDRDKKTHTSAWRMRVVPDVTGGCTGYSGDEFLFDDGETAYAENLGEILHCQFGDLNTDPPFMYNAMRSLGFLLVEPCFYANLARCRTLQYLFESFNTWFRVTDPTGKSRANDIQLYDKAIIPEGVSIVPREQRHQVDANLIEMVMSQLKQLQGEASSSYTQQSDTGTSREQTAYETSVKVAQVNAMMSGMLLVAFFQKRFAYTEICRRFCIRDSSDEDVKAFQAKMKRLGIPSVFLNVDLWDIDPEIPLGAGNPTMEQSQAQQLMGFRPMLDPEAQRKVLHTTIAAVTQNSALAEDLVPMEQNKLATDGQKWAASIFGTLMQGIPVPQNTSVSSVEQIDNLIGMMAGVITRITQTGNMSTYGELAGLNAVAQYLGMLIQQVADDPQNAPRAKVYSQQLGNMTNIMKGFQQRLQEQSQAKEGGDDSAAKTQAMLMQAQAKSQIDMETARQNMDRQQKEFVADQERKNAEFIQEQQRLNLAKGAEMSRATEQTSA